MVIKIFPFPAYMYLLTAILQRNQFVKILQKQIKLVGIKSQFPPIQIIKRKEGKNILINNKITELEQEVSQLTSLT